MSKTTHMTLIELRDPEGREIREIVRAALEGSRSLDEAGAKLGIAGATLCRWLPRLGISTNRRMETRERITCAAGVGGA